jgi:phosphoglycolate phosphatase
MQLSKNLIKPMQSMKKNIQHIIFDLDGTLIDSSPSILAAFEGAFLKAHLQAVKPFSPEIIGPPLKETLKILLGDDDPEKIGMLAALFKEQYDTVGYKKTSVFAGVEHLLKALAATETPLYIATNKRIKPTLLILEHLGWLPYFKAVYALDMPEAQAKTKTELIAYVLKKHEIQPADAFYIGDRQEDKKAALANMLQFCYAKWGYDAEVDADDQVLGFESPEGMLGFFISN